MLSILSGIVAVWVGGYSLWASLYKNEEEKPWLRAASGIASALLIYGGFVLLH